MRRNSKYGEDSSCWKLLPASEGESVTAGSGDDDGPVRSGFGIMALFAAVACSSWLVYDFEYNHLPTSLTAAEAGPSGFSEVEALKHANALTGFGPRSVGSDALDHAVQYVLNASQEIKKNASSEVNVEVKLFKAKSGANVMGTGLFEGKTVAYSDLNHVLLKIMPKHISNYSNGEDDIANILVSGHIDTVFSGEDGGATSNIAVMLELARGISQSSQGFGNAVIFFFNTGEEEGLSGSHSFITQHPWKDKIKLNVDLEALGIGGKSGIFQAGPDSSGLENFAKAAKYPSGQVATQEIFASGMQNSATDFQVYKEIGGLSGMDFAFTDNTAVYHTKNDKLELLKPGSLQHLGENLLPFLLQAASTPDESKAIKEGESTGRSDATYFDRLVHLGENMFGFFVQIARFPHLLKATAVEEKTKADQSSPVYFDILGSYMVVFQQSSAELIYNAVIGQSLLVLAISLLIGGYEAVVSFVLSCLSLVLTWVSAVGLAVLVAFVLPLISSSPSPFVASPWLVLGLFAAPALIGALAGQSLGYAVLETYLSATYSTRKHLSSDVRAYSVKAEAERWLYKAGSIQWLVLLILGNYFQVGSSYLAFAWLVSPTFAYGLLEATLSPSKSPNTLKLATLGIGLVVPILISAGVLIRLPITLIETLVRFDSNPGSSSEWLGNVIVAVLIAVIMCSTMVYLLSYVHLSGVKNSIILSASLLFALSIVVVSLGVVPPFSEETPRAVNVVHVVDSTGNKDPTSYISLFSTSPGELTKEAEQIDEGFRCGDDYGVDFVTFSARYGCRASTGNELGWTKSDLPSLRHNGDSNGPHKRTSHVTVETKSSTRWALAINFEEIEDFALIDSGKSETVVPFGEKKSIDGWHTLQFSGGKNASKKFDLTLVWSNNSSQSRGDMRAKGEERPLLKLRVDSDKRTAKVARIISKLPSWCSLYGKSTYPQTLAYLYSLPINF